MQQSEKTKAPSFQDNIKKQVERDKKILKFLAAGPTTLDHLHRQIFTNEMGEPIFLPTAKTRLDKLVKMGYIKSKRYPRIVAYKGLLMYALDELGINDACVQFSFNRDFIRNDFPPAARVTHEILVSDMIRTVWRELEEGKYKLNNIFDDREMKRQYHLEKRNRKLEKKKIIGREIKFFPDLCFKILPLYKDEMVFNMELDSGNKGPNYWKPKIASWPDVTLVLTLNSQRMEILKNYVIESGRKQATGFAIVSDFLRNGLSATEWFWVPQNLKAKIALK